MDTLTLAVVGAAYGTSIAIGLSRKSGARDATPERLLAGMMLCCVAAIATIVLQHRFDAFVPLLERIEYVASLSTGPLLVLYVRSIRGHGPTGRDTLHVLPAFAALILPALNGDPLLGMPIQLVVLHQISYTIASALSRLRAKAELIRHRRMSLAAIALMLVIHVAQLVRSVWSDVELLKDVVPVTLSIMLVLAGAVALGRMIRVAGSRKRRDSLTGVEGALEAVIPSSSILERLDGLMERDHLYRDPGLGLRSLSERLGVTPHQLSGELNSVAGISLNEYLGQKRLEDAKRRLRDPSHAIYTIEGIAGMSGFGSRSSFYTIFKRETGMTPAEFSKNR